MAELFGIPTAQLTSVLLGVLAVGTLILAILALRDPTSFRMAIRNLPRRKVQTALIVVGLMLATILFSTAFITGDTLTNSLRIQALEGVGRVDVVVRAERPESGGGVAFGPGAGISAAPEAREEYFDQDLAGEIRDSLSGVGSIAGVAPLAEESGPVTAAKANLSEPRVDVLGMDAEHMKGFDDLRTASGKTVSVNGLDKYEVYVSQDTADGLGIGLGDKIEATLVRPPSEPQSRQRPGATQAPFARQEAGDGQRPPWGGGAWRPTGTPGERKPPELEVAGVYESGANPASNTSMVMLLEELQKLVGEERKVNEVLISHRGQAVEGGRYTDKTLD